MESFEERTAYPVHASGMHNSTVVKGELKKVFWEEEALVASGLWDPGLTLQMRGTLP